MATAEEARLASFPELANQRSCLSFFKLEIGECSVSYSWVMETVHIIKGSGQDTLSRKRLHTDIYKTSER